MAALEALSVAVANGAFVPWHSPQSQSTGTNIYFGLTPKVKSGPMDPLGSQFEVDSPSDFRASRDGSGPSGQIRAPQDKPGPSRTNQVPAERIKFRTDQLGQPEPRGANQGPAGRVRATGRIGSRGMSQGPAEKKSTNWDRSGPCGVNQSIIRWIMARETEQGPVRRSRAPRDEPGPRSSNQGHLGRIWAPQDQPGPAGRIRSQGLIEPRVMSQGPAEQIRACGTLSGP